ncbi:MAG: HTTM domain-containing protein [Myxococcales bacterium]|nr:HTTM domain-containing protein [Myxococcales bacterium]
MWSRFVALANAKEPVVGLAIFRVLVGLFLFEELFTAWWVGVDRALWLPPEHGGMVPLSDPWQFHLLGGATPATLSLVLWGTMAAALLVSAGALTRVASLVALQGFLALMFLNVPCGGGHDKLITNALWILALSPAGTTASVDCRVRTGGWVDATPRAWWPRWVLGLQIACTYTYAGWAKMGPEWWPWGGWKAVYLSILQPQWNELDSTWVAFAYPLTQLATILTMVFECGFFLVPLWMALRHRTPWLRRYDVRVPFLLLAFVMHATLETFMNLGPFARISVAYYLLLFDADEYARAWRALRGLFGAPHPAEAT